MELTVRDETALDLEQTGGMAPKAHLVYYDLPLLSDGNIFLGLTTVLNMNVVDVLSMSFGTPDKLFTAEYNGGQDYTGYLQIYDDFFAQGNAQGITFVASSGMRAHWGCHRRRASIRRPRARAAGCSLRWRSGFEPACDGGRRNQSGDDDAAWLAPFGVRFAECRR